MRSTNGAGRRPDPKSACWRVETKERIVRRHSTVRAESDSAALLSWLCRRSCCSRSRLPAVGPQVRLCVLVCCHFVRERLWIGTIQLVMD
jgi:hypothetical protein